MNIFTLLTLAIGLSMKKVSMKKILIVGTWFGFFQGLMPFIGYVLGVQFKDSITSIDHWVAFLLLSLIGINMIKESFSKQEECENDSLKFKIMFILAIATSIDALAAGITFAFLDVNIIMAVLFIGIITFIISMLGVKLGNVFGLKYKTKAEMLGGIILIALGIKILLEHTM